MIENEEWRPVVGYEGLYEVSNIGRVNSIGKGQGRKNGIMSTKGVGGSGYHSVMLAKNSVSTRLSLHRVVAQAFVPNPLGQPEVNHIDANKLNNDASNLEWCNRNHNLLHAIHLGLVDRKGENCGGAKLTNKIVINIRHCKGSISARDLASLYKLKVRHIYQLWSRDTWRHI